MFAQHGRSTRSEIFELLSSGMQKLQADASAATAGATANKSGANTVDNLQHLLTQAGSQFTLLPHQHAVTSPRVAGVPSSRPFENNNFAVDEPPTRGLILADEMGLGKTVSVLSGVLARRKFDDGPH